MKIYDYECAADEIENIVDDIIVDFGFIDIVIPGAIYVSPSSADGYLNDPDYSSWFTKTIIAGFRAKGIGATVELVEMGP